MKLKIGVMGTATEKVRQTSQRKAYEIGRHIALQDCIIVTGACPGLPYWAARGCKEAGGFSLGISPGLSLDEHIHKYQAPADQYDVLVFTGSGLMGRELTNIRTSDFVVVIGGRSGTLGEFAIAYDEGKLVGVLKSSGGISGEIERIVRLCRKKTGAKLLYDVDPKRLIGRLLRDYKTSHFKKPSVFSRRRSSLKEDTLGV
ncbi:MAG TPA: hypothetical protein VGL91_00940 [Acidobacteriota bacterium]